MDKPPFPAGGKPGQFASLDSDGNTVWRDRAHTPVAVPLPVDVDGLAVASSVNRCARCPGNCYRPACPWVGRPRLADFVPTQPAQLPRLWCALSKGPCNGDCYGSECELRLATANAITAPGALAPEREPRMPEGSQLVVASMGGIAVGALLVLVYEWWPW